MKIKYVIKNDSKIDEEKWLMMTIEIISDRKKWIKNHNKYSGCIRTSKPKTDIEYLSDCDTRMRCDSAEDLSTIKIDI